MACLANLPATLSASDQPDSPPSPPNDKTPTLPTPPPLEGDQSPPKSAKGHWKTPLYRPPLRGAPDLTLGAGTRNVQLPGWTALAPRDPALTSHPQPILYWYAPESSLVRLRIFRLEANQETEVFAWTSPQPGSPGLQWLDLRQTDFRLPPEVLHAWEIGPVRASSNDRLPWQGILHRPWPHLSAQWSDLAGRGYWYDLLPRVLRSSTDNRPAESVLDDLLQQAGLSVDHSWLFQDAPRK